MKRLFKDILASAVWGLVLPGMILNYGAKVQRHTSQTLPPETEASVYLPVKHRSSEGTVEEKDMDSYLEGVVLAEMPAYFEEEALKAQAVVARTYARKAWETGGKHSDGSVCDDPGCCQGWISEEAYLQQGGREENVEKIKNAVNSTSGQVLTYAGELIEATYFSCSGGRTEDAAAVWGTDFPYLQAVDSPGEEKAVYYHDEAVFGKRELEEKLGISLGNPLLEAVSYTEGGGIETAVIGGKEFTGVELRSLLGLKSTAFSVETRNDTVVIATRGYGHRVGMSQYGADAMAVAGSTYDEILAHYYQGTALTRLD